MTPFDYEFLRKLIRERSGLALSNEKKYLVESRLAPVARRAGLDGISALVARLRLGRSEALAVEVVEAMATNETFFLRDKSPFEQLRRVMIPQLTRARAARRRIRVWCAACSTGQEAYSIAMSLDAMRDALDGWRVDIVATDFSREVIARAERGLYSQFEVQRGLPIQLLIEHFTQVGDMWQVSAALRRMVRFQHFNMLDDPMRLGVFDIVFCRNLMIYLGHDTKAELLERLARATDPAGYLVLGAAESVVGLSSAWKPHAEERGLFVPARAFAAAPRLMLAGATP